MESDINVIIDVDPGEAQALVELIETLFEDWYGARYRRDERLTRIKSIGTDKRSEIEAARNKKEEKPT